jgi:hypothetical protein
MAKRDWLHVLRREAFVACMRAPLPSFHQICLIRGLWALCIMGAPGQSLSPLAAEHLMSARATAGVRFEQVAGITAEEDARLLPGPPGRVEATRSSAGVIVRWPGTRLRIITSYRVYRSCGGGDWIAIADVPVQDDNLKSFSVFDASPAEACQYAVSAKDAYGNEGPRSTPVSPQRQ